VSTNTFPLGSVCVIGAFLTHTHGRPWMFFFVPTKGFGFYTHADTTMERGIEERVEIERRFHHCAASIDGDS